MSGTYTRLGSDRQRRTGILAVGLPTALTLGLCLYHLGERSLWLDEAATVAIASQHGAALGSALAHEGGNMLGYYGLLHVVIALFGSGAVAIRLPSVLGAVATVGVLAWLALRMFGQRVALLAGGLAAVSLTLVYWGQNARGYTLMTALICGSFLAFLSLVRARGRSWPAWLAYVILTTAAAYAGLEAVLVVPAQLIILTWHSDRVRPVALAVAAIMACCVPLAVLAAQRGSGQLFWVPAPNGKTLRHVIESLASSGLEPDFYTGTGVALRWLTVALVVAAMVGIGFTLVRHRGRVKAWRESLVLAWLLVPLALVVVISEASHSIFEPRYLLISLPAVALLLAWLLDRLWDLPRSPRVRAGPAILLLARGATVALLAALIALRALQLAPSYGRPSEPWREVAGYVMAHAQPGDCLAFYPLDVRMPFRYYVAPAQHPPTPILPSLPWRLVRPFVEDYTLPPAGQLVPRANGCSRIWLVSSHAGEADGTSGSQANYRSYLSLRARLASSHPVIHGATFGYVGIISVILFARGA